MSSCKDIQLDNDNCTSHENFIKFHVSVANDSTNDETHYYFETKTNISSLNKAAVYDKVIKQIENTDEYDCENNVCVFLNYVERIHTVEVDDVSIISFESLEEDEEESFSDFDPDFNSTQNALGSFSNKRPKY